MRLPTDDLRPFRVEIPRLSAVVAEVVELARRFGRAGRGGRRRALRLREVAAPALSLDELPRALLEAGGSQTAFVLFSNRA
jgi:hypothetical protein